MDDENIVADGQIDGGQVNEPVEDTTDEPDLDTNAVSELEKGLDGLFEDDWQEDVDNPEEGEPDGEEPDGDTTESEDDEYEDIPQDQVDVARSLGYSDDQIVQLAESNPRVLEDMVKLHTARQAVPSQGEVKRDTQEPKPAEKLEHVNIPGLDKMPAESQAALTAMLQAHNAMIDKLNAQNEQLAKVQETETKKTVEEQAAYERKIDSYFDSISEHLPEVGKGNVDQSQQLARQEIYGIAYMLQQTRGVDLDTALDEASYMWGLSKYDLDDLEKQAEERVREKLNKNKKRFTPRPGGQKTNKKYRNMDEEALDILGKGLDGLFE